MDITSGQWEVLEPLIPKPPRRPDGRGRPWRDSREVLNGVLWVLRTGAPWHNLPDTYPPYQTCHRRFQQWVRTGALEQILKALSEDLWERRGLDLSECFIDGTFVAAKKGGLCVGKTRRGKGTKIMTVADRIGLPLSVYATSASPHEVNLVEPTLNARFLEEKPERLIGDKAFDSDSLDKTLEAEGIEMIAPHRDNRKKSPTQDGRILRRIRRRWKVERLIGWLQNFRRLVVRYEHHIENFLGFIHLSCIIILLKAFMR